MYGKPMGTGLTGVAGAGGLLAFTGFHFSIAILGLLILLLGVILVRIASRRRKY